MLEQENPLVETTSYKWQSPCVREVQECQELKIDLHEVKNGTHVDPSTYVGQSESKSKFAMNLQSGNDWQ